MHIPTMAYRLLLLLATGIILAGCASSGVSRGAESGVDKGVQSSRNVYDNMTAESDPALSYSNSSQTTKGALIGGASGAVVGAMSSKIGVFSGAAVGAMVGAGIGAYVDAHTTLEDRLANRGILIVVLGDQVLLVIPSVTLFEPGTATIKQEAYSTLNMVSAYINRYTKTLVKISAFTSPLGPENVNIALSKDQAHHVENYLLETGMDSRVIYAEGFGGTHLVARPSSTANWDSSDNYRVEITLEKLDA